MYRWHFDHPGPIAGPTCLPVKKQSKAMPACMDEKDARLLRYCLWLLSVTGFYVGYVTAHKTLQLLHAFLRFLLVAVLQCDWYRACVLVTGEILLRESKITDYRYNVRDPQP